MKLGFNEATALKCKGQSLMADLEACEKYGYDYIEMRFDCVKEYLKEHTLDELAAWFGSHRLKPWAYNTLEFFNQLSPDEEEAMDREIDFIIKVCNAVGMKMLITVPTFNIKKDLSIEEIKEEAVARIRHIADKIAPHGMRVSLEFCGVPGCSINQFGTAYDVVMAAQRDNVGITLDTYHFHAMDSHWEDLEKADPKKIFAYHLNDCENLPIGAPYLLDDKRLWPGEGCLDHKRTCEILNRIGFDGVCTVELFRPEYYELDHDDNVRIAKEKSLAAVGKYYNFD